MAISKGSVPLSSSSTTFRSVSKACSKLAGASGSDTPAPIRLRLQHLAGYPAACEADRHQVTLTHLGGIGEQRSGIRQSAHGVAPRENRFWIERPQPQAARLHARAGSCEPAAEGPQ